MQYSMGSIYSICSMLHLEVSKDAFSLALKRILFSSEITGYSDWREFCLCNSSWLFRQYNITWQLSQCITFLKRKRHRSEVLPRCLAQLPVWITRNRPLQHWLAHSRMLFGQILLFFAKNKDNTQSKSHKHSSHLPTIRTVCNLQW